MPSVQDFPLLHVVVSAVIHEARASEKEARRRRESERRRDRLGDRDRLQHLRVLPWGAAEGDRERQRHVWRQDREKETCIVAGGVKKN